MQLLLLDQLKPKKSCKWRVPSRGGRGPDVVVRDNSEVRTGSPLPNSWKPMHFDRCCNGLGPWGMRLTFTSGFRVSTLGLERLDNNKARPGLPAALPRKVTALHLDTWLWHALGGSMRQLRMLSGQQCPMLL
ncbi:unnamed protein product [Ostreobium quekettii]|uniref:Uncharacterized protein n=1 Tax=Ostreobium quekettii TaxID=121088 RepID=A0A8S1INZ9_9CHLO|nr:unnamed protein product [Ostreobium quekettii]